MSRMKLIAILVVMAIPFSIGEYASAASTMTKTIEYSADRAEEKQDVSKVVEQDGKKWKDILAKALTVIRNQKREQRY